MKTNTKIGQMNSDEYIKYASKDLRENPSKSNDKRAELYNLGLSMQRVAAVEGRLIQRAFREVIGASSINLKQAVTKDGSKVSTATGFKVEGDTLYIFLVTRSSDAKTNTTHREGMKAAEKAIKEVVPPLISPIADFNRVKIKRIQYLDTDDFSELNKIAGGKDVKAYIDSKLEKLVENINSN